MKFFFWVLFRSFRRIRTETNLGLGIDISRNRIWLAFLLAISGMAQPEKRHHDVSPHLMHSNFCHISSLLSWATSCKVHIKFLECRFFFYKYIYNLIFRWSNNTKNAKYFNPSVIVKIIHFFNLSAARFKKISNLVYVDPYAHCVPLNIHTAGIPHLSYLGIKVLAPWAQLKASAPTKARHNSKIKACANGCSLRQIMMNGYFLSTSQDFTLIISM